jgi:hypothetical protein
MATEIKPKLQVEIGHVFFMDVVGYSKLLVDEQSDVMRQLNRIVRDTEQVRTAEAKGNLVRLPTGDGMALVFFASPEFAMICVLAGEKDLALQQLKTLAKIPSNLDYGRLRLETVWDPLRGDPRFEKIVESLAPKDGRK